MNGQSWINRFMCHVSTVYNFSWLFRTNRKKLTIEFIAINYFSDIHNTQRVNLNDLRDHLAFLSAPQVLFFLLHIFNYISQQDGLTLYGKACMTFNESNNCGARLVRFPSVSLVFYVKC